MQTRDLLQICHSTHVLTTLIFPYNTTWSAPHKQEWSEKKVERLKRKWQMNKFVCVRTGVQTRLQTLFPGKYNIIYLHNLHKLLFCHITLFVPAFHRRSLPPIFPQGEGTATRRLEFPPLSDNSRRFSKIVSKARQAFPNIFWEFPKISEDVQRFPKITEDNK